MEFVVDFQRFGRWKISISSKFLSFNDNPKLERKKNFRQTLLTTIISLKSDTTDVNAVESLKSKISPNKIKKKTIVKVEVIVAMAVKYPKQTQTGILSPV